MILSSEQGRLSERITKFLVTQVGHHPHHMYHPSLRISHIKFSRIHSLLIHHQVYVLDPGGLEAPAQQEHRPLRSET